MNIADTLTSVLSEDSISGLKWVEYERRDIRKFLGLKPEEGFPEDILGGKTPDDFGDDIWYQIVTESVTTNYWREFQNTRPIHFEHFLRFNFAEMPDGVAVAYDHPLAYVEGFEYLRKALLNFNFGLYSGTGDPYVELKSQNLRFHNNGDWGERNTFTERGIRCMETILAQKDRIVGIPGLEPAYNGALKQYLDVLEQQYRQKEIEPRGI